MLDIIRKKASDWGVKVIFGIIIVVFVFFFGYNRISQRYKGGGGGVVARVDGTAILWPEFQFVYDNTYKMYQNIFKGKEDEPLPDNIIGSVRTSALNQLVQQQVIKKLGERLGLEPTPEELADAIRNSPVAKGEDGQFDPFLYKQRFLPYFAQKFNFDYEDMLKGEILAQKVQETLALSGRVPNPKGFYDIEKTKWTLEISEKGGTPRKVGPISLSGRSQLFPAADEDAAVFEKIFSMKARGQSVTVTVADKEYAIKLLAFDIPTSWGKDREDYIKTLNAGNEREFYQDYVSSLLKKTKVKTYIDAKE